VEGSQFFLFLPGRQGETTLFPPVRQELQSCLAVDGIHLRKPPLLQRTDQGSGLEKDSFSFPLRTASGGWRWEAAFFSFPARNGGLAPFQNCVTVPFSSGTHHLIFQRTKAMSFFSLPRDPLLWGFFLFSFNGETIFLAFREENFFPNMSQTAKPVRCCSLLQVSIVPFFFFLFPLHLSFLCPQDSQRHLFFMTSVFFLHLFLSLPRTEMCSLFLIPEETKANFFFFSYTECRC